MEEPRGILGTQKEEMTPINTGITNLSALVCGRRPRHHRGRLFGLIGL